MNVPQYKTWQEQFEHSITTIEELSKYIPMSPKEKKDYQKVTNKFPLCVTPYFLSLINPNDSNKLRREKGSLFLDNFIFFINSSSLGINLISFFHFLFAFQFPFPRGVYWKRKS